MHLVRHSTPRAEEAPGALRSTRAINSVKNQTPRRHRGRPQCGGSCAHLTCASSVEQPAIPPLAAVAMARAAIGPDCRASPRQHCQAELIGTAGTSNSERDEHPPRSSLGEAPKRITHHTYPFESACRVHPRPRAVSCAMLVGPRAKRGLRPRAPSLKAIRKRADPIQVCSSLRRWWWDCGDIVHCWYCWFEHTVSYYIAMPASRRLSYPHFCPVRHRSNEKPEARSASRTARTTKGLAGE